MNNDFLVSVRCISYNHAPYIKDCMNGFTMQETNFPYVCVIDDDASTDGEPEVITNYLAEHFDMDDKDVVRREETNDYRMIFAQHKTNKNCFFAVYFLKYNHYSIRKSRDSYVERFVDGSKYIAICEGDDYWIDPLKLQKQVVFLDSHEDCSMTCNRTKLYSVMQKRYIGEVYCYNRNQYVRVKDVILRGGLFISTCSIMFRKKLLNAELPDYFKLCHIGDYPLQILAAMKGKIYYLNDKMSVYRVDNVSSYMGQRKNLDIHKRISSVRSEVNMLDGFMIDYPKYSTYFKRRVYAYVNRNIPDRNASLQHLMMFNKEFKNEIDSYPFFWKVDYWIRSCRVRGIKRAYSYLSSTCYSHKSKLY